MIVYNVTITVEKEIAADWLQWMTRTHIGEVMATGQFSGYRFSRLLEQEEDAEPTFVVQYYCATMEDYKRYIEVHAPVMRQCGYERFGSRFIAFRTVMETLEMAIPGYNKGM